MAILKYQGNVYMIIYVRIQPCDNIAIFCHFDLISPGRCSFSCINRSSVNIPIKFLYQLISPRNNIIKVHLTQGRSIGEIVTLGRVRLLREAGEQARPALQSHPEFKTLVSQLVEAALRLDDEGVQEYLDQAFSLSDAEAVIDGVMQPAARSIGNLRHQGQALISSERVLSTAFASRLHRLLEAENYLYPQKPLVVCCCPPGEQHFLGALIVSFVLMRNRVSTSYLEPLPLADLEDYCFKKKIRFLLLSVSQPQLFEDFWGDCHQLARRNPQLTVVVGGAGISSGLSRRDLPGNLRLWPESRSLRDLVCLLQNRLEGRGEAAQGKNRSGGVASDLEGAAASD